MSEIRCAMDMHGTIVEYRTEKAVAFPASGGEDGEVLRVECREKGTRTWAKFVIVPDTFQGVEEVDALAGHAATAYLGLDFQREIADAAQT